MRLTVTEALVKLKLAEKKVADATSSLFVCCNTTKGNKAMPGNFKSQEEAKQEAKRQLDSANGLVEFRDKLKRAIVKSNAATTVSVGSKSMTVAEAIEQKASIEHKKNLLAKLERDCATSINLAERHNATLDKQVDDYLAKIFSSKDGVNEEVRQAARKDWLDQNTMITVMADKTKETIQKLKTDIEEFESNVDVALSVANAQTYIEVSD